LKFEVGRARQQKRVRWQWRVLRVEWDLGVPMRSVRLVETGSLFRYISKPPPLTYGQMAISPWIVRVLKFSISKVRLFKKALK
jgi:hypothetical protein